MQFISTSSEATLAEVLQLSLEGNHESVVLVDRGANSRPLGVLSSRDLALLIQKGTDLKRRALDFSSPVPSALLETGTVEDGTPSYGILESNERKFQNIFNSIVDGYVLATVEGEIRMVNPSTLRILGYSDPSDMVGKNITNVVYYDPAQRKEMLAKLFSTGVVKNHEVTVKRKDGTILYCEANFRLYRDEKGTPIEVDGLFRDVTERKEAENKLRLSEERYRSVVASMNEGVVLQGREGEIFDCNDSAARILGMSREQILGLTSGDPKWSAIHEDGSPFPGEEHPAMYTLRTGLPESDVVMGLRHGDGSLRWISINSLPVGGGATPSAVVTTFSDITERKEMLDRLRSSEHRFRELFNNMSSGVAIYRALQRDVDFVFEDINKAGLRITNLQRDGVVGHRLTEIFPSMTTFGLLEILRRVHATGEAETMPTSLYEDASISIWVRNYVYRLPSGEVVAVFDDMTKYQESLLALEKLNSSLEHRVIEEVQKRRSQEEMLIKQSRIGAMGEVIRNIAHHWRQPLTVLSLILQNIEEDFSAGTMEVSEVHANVRQSLDIIDGLSRTIDEFRNFFRAAQDDIFFDCVLALQETVELLRKELGYNGISIRLHQGNETDRYTIFGRPNEFKHAFLNIISNSRDAIKEMEHSGRLRPGDGWIAVEVRALGGDSVEIVVEDNGGGVPSHILEHVFDPYFSTKSASYGTGMGLYIARIILENDMGASVRMENGHAGARLVVQISSDGKRRRRFHPGV